MRQFFLQRESAQIIQCGDVVALDQDESHHLFTVLRGGRNSQIHLTDGIGHRYEGISAGKSGKKALVEIVSCEHLEDETCTPHLALYCGVVKAKKFELVLEKAVELGVHRIVPVLTEHGVVDPRDKKQDRWNTILKTALKQSLRCTLPSLESAMSLADALAEGAGAQRFFGAVPGELSPGLSVKNWSEIMGESHDPSVQRLDLFVGPEGGWSPDERNLLLEHGCLPIDLGPHVLRTETAAIAGLALLQAVRKEKK